MGTLLRSLLTAAVLLCLATAPLGAQQATVPLGPLTVWPPDARVSTLTSRGLEPLGQADQPLRVTVPQTLRYNPVILVFSAPGYQDRQISVLLSGQPLDPVRLTADNLWVDVRTVVRVHPLIVVCVGWGLAVLGLVAHRLVRRYRRLVERNARLERLVAARPDENLSGAVVGRYRLLKKIGQGGMAVVFEAVPDSEGSHAEHVAMKLIHTQVDNNPEYVARFRREVVITSKLSHPCVIRVLDFGDHLGAPYLVMELLLGDTLKGLIQRGPMDVAQFLPLYRDILEGVCHAHDHGVIHRDLKPANIFIRRNGHPVVMDFGIARDSVADTLTGTGLMLGTPMYMAPEQVNGTKPTASTDQYALGVIGYEMLAGKLPFEGDSSAHVLYSKLIVPAPSIDEVRSNLPSELVTVINRMLCIQPIERFVALRDVLTALSALERI